MEQHHFSWFDLVPPLAHQPHHVIAATVVALLMLVASLTWGRAFKKPEALIPSPRITLRNFFEVFAGAFVGLMKNIIGPKEYKHFAPLLLTLATFILFSNLLGMIPGFLPSTDNINTTAACAVIVFCYTHYTGFKHHGMHYLKHFTGPIWWMAPLMFPIEIISHLARPFALSVRLFVNIFADHVLLGVFLGLVPLIIPIPFIFLGVFVAVIQTLIFTTLSMVYFSMSLEEGH